jgi:hypothetical protein
MRTKIKAGRTSGGFQWRKNLLEHGPAPLEEFSAIAMGHDATKVAL